MEKMESRKVIESVKEILREVCEDICDNYCKYRETADEVG